jgi:predicted nucleic acid-binding protein
MPKTYLILDANVLIDYFKSDPSVLKVVSSHLGELFVALPVLEEVKEVDQSLLESFGVVVVVPELDILLEAEIKKGALSFQDRVCLLLAKKGGWSCVSNDKPLRRECETESIPVMWGLEMMILLVEVGKLDQNTAFEVANKIHLENPKYIGKGVLEDFKVKIGFVEKRKK